MKKMVSIEAGKASVSVVLIQGVGEMPFLLFFFNQYTK